MCVCVCANWTREEGVYPLCSVEACASNVTITRQKSFSPSGVSGWGLACALLCAISFRCCLPQSFGEELRHSECRFRLFFPLRGSWEDDEESETILLGRRRTEACWTKSKQKEKKPKCGGVEGRIEEGDEINHLSSFIYALKD